MTRLFGTDGVRGIANAELTPELAFRLGEAAGHFLGEKGRGKIVVGRDTRRSGEMLEAALVAGICSGGADALVAGIVPTPGGRAARARTRGRRRRCHLGVAQRARVQRHQVLQPRRLQASRRGRRRHRDVLRVASATTSGRPAAHIGTIRQVDDAVERYIEHCVATIDVDLTGLTVAVDCGHGAASVATPEALRRLGATGRLGQLRLGRHGHQRRLRIDEPRTARGAGRRKRRRLRHRARRRR